MLLLVMCKRQKEKQREFPSFYSKLYSLSIFSIQQRGAITLPVLFDRGPVFLSVRKRSSCSSSINTYRVNICIKLDAVRFKVWKYEGSMLVRNVGSYLQEYPLSQT